MEKNQNKNVIPVIPIILFSSVVPMIVYIKIVYLPQELQTMYGGSKCLPDFFSYYKSILIIFSAVLATIMLVYFKIKHNVKIIKNKVAGLIFICLVLIVLSIVFSEHKNTSLFGFVNLYEGGLVLISYLFMMYYTNIMITNKNQCKILLNCILISTTIICIIGIFQYFGYDILLSSFFSKAIIPSKYHGIINQLTSASGKYMIYSTISNPNYVGSYMSMLLPMTIMLSFKADTNKQKKSYYFISTLVFANLIGSRSNAGLLGAIIGFIAISLLLSKRLQYKKKETVVLSTLFTLVILVMFMSAKGSIEEKYKAIIEADIGNVEKQKTINQIEYINNGVKISTKTNILFVMLDEANIVFKDNNQDDLKVVIADEDKLIFDNPKYREFGLKFIPENNLVLLSVNDDIIRLVGINTEGIKILNYKGDVVESLEVAKINLDEKFASGRGYIWSRTIPLLKENILIGSGADNFTYEFPQDDIDGKYRVYGDDTILVNKPHNMYLQIAINTGVISVVVFIIVVTLSLLSGFRSKNLIVNSISAGVLGYLVAGLFNDSVVSVAPVFWTLMGIILPDGRIYYDWDKI